MRTQDPEIRNPELERDEVLRHRYDEDKVALQKTWQLPQGFFGWFRDISHQSIGKRYIYTAFIFFLLGGLESLLMRVQLAKPENRLLSPDFYNQLFTVHGTTMMFLFAVPMMEGLGIYLVPLMLGTRDLAFPRLNALGYYLYLFGGLFLYWGFLTNTGPDAGWFSYTPLSGPSFSPGKRSDVWAQMITFTELSTLIVAVDLIVTVMKHRAPGMSLNRMPMFVWAMFVQSFMIVFAMPSIMVCSGMLMLDRTIGTHFFNPAEGGDPILWQHLFWFFGHPEVYIIFVPALGFVSHIIAAMTKRPVFGYTALVLSIIATGFIGFGLWVHHMFATGLPQLASSFFTSASLMIAIPSGVQIFCWLATIWSKRPRLESPMLFVIGFFLIFVLGGLSGVMIAAVPFDLQVHDTYFIVAHFHYVLIGGAVFPLFGALYYWFPKISGRRLSERLGAVVFALMFVGFNFTFFPMHILGLLGMPRRVYTYPPNMGWTELNFMQTMGAFVLGLGILVFLIDVLKSRRSGALAGNNPWDAGTLEWGTTSPPPNYSFVHLPIVRGREPLWAEPEEARNVVVGLRTDVREMLSTDMLDALPNHRVQLPRPTIWPFLVAVTGTFGLIGSVFNMWLFIYGAALTVIPFIGWFWPERNEPKVIVTKRA